MPLLYRSTRRILAHATRLHLPIPTLDNLSSTACFGPAWSIRVHALISLARISPFPEPSPYETFSSYFSQLERHDITDGLTSYYPDSPSFQFWIPIRTLSNLFFTAHLSALVPNSTTVSSSARAVAICLPLSSLEASPFKPFCPSFPRPSDHKPILRPVCRRERQARRSLFGRPFLDLRISGIS